MTEKQIFRRIDIHAHLNFAAFDADRDEAVKRAFDSGTAVINVGTNAKTSRDAVLLADKYERGMYAMIGLHPIHTMPIFHDKDEFGDDVTEEEVEKKFDPALYREFLGNPKVVGIGECGLDYYRLDEKTKAVQKEAFLAQIELANEFNKPLMLHVREAYDDAIDILKSHAKVKGNSHFFAGTIEQARKFLDLGCTLSFTGVITFARQYEELVKFVPLDMIHAETDCPYVAPVPYRGKRNEPSYVSEVVDKIARIKKLPTETVEQALITNARNMWGVNI